MKMKFSARNENVDSRCLNVVTLAREMLYMW